ncbi:ankyrin repeat domain-containing protein [Candidatus Dependentiae bacterium]
MGVMFITAMAVFIPILYCQELYRNKKYVLNRAAGSGDINLINILLAKGKNINLKDEDGKTPLDNAASCNCTQAVRLLLENGAHPSYNAFLKAMDRNNLKIITLLLEKGLDVNKTIDYSCRFGISHRSFYYDSSLLTIALHDSNNGLVKLIIDKGAKIEPENIESLSRCNIFKKTLENHTRINQLIQSINNKENINESIRLIEPLIEDDETPAYDKQTAVLSLFNLRKRSQNTISEETLKRLTRQVLCNNRLLNEEAFKDMVTFATENELIDTKKNTPINKNKSDNTLFGKIKNIVCFWKKNSNPC